MYKMIIIDDEPQIRKGLRTIIEWAEYGIEIAGEAGDGLEALNRVFRVKPHIALVDISMPKMNGLEFMKKIKTLENPPQCIMLSGYGTFEFVRESMRLGAATYLLKPVNLEELHSAVRQVTSLIDDIAAQKMQFRESLEALRNQTLYRLLNNKIEFKELREKCEVIGIDLRCRSMMAGILKPEFDNSDNTLRWIMFGCLGICEEETKEKISCYPVADLYDNIVFIIRNEKSFWDTGGIQEILDNCAREIRKKINLNSITVLGPAVPSFRELYQSYGAALNMLKLKNAWNWDPADVSFRRVKDRDNYSPNIQKTVQYINQNYQDPGLCLKTMAFKLNVNPAYLGRQFSRETGEYFSDYLNKVRINQAKNLLQNAGCKTAEISAMTGFSSLSYFYTVFKKVTGSTPDNIRQGQDA
jgi:two-component system response regulator YesN